MVRKSNQKKVNDTLPTKEGNSPNLEGKMPPLCSGTSFDGLYKTRLYAMFIRYCLLSTFVKRDISPLSAMLIAPPEENKTRIMMVFLKFRTAMHPVDISMKPLVDLIQAQEEKQKIFHIIIPDFIKAVYHKASVVDAVIGTLLGLIDEGIDQNLFFGQVFKLKRRVQMGLVTGITPELFRKHFRKWTENGFLTRIFPISYRYTDDTCQEIAKFISEDLPIIVDDTIAKAKQRGIREIKIGSDISAAIRILTEDVIQRLRTFSIVAYSGKKMSTKSKSGYRIYFDIKGFRLQKMLRLLIKSIAYDRGHDEANYEDLETLRELANLIRLPDNPREV
jgi:hypothetical protein